jgi:predicted ArsR family transcriptional regulator
MDVPQGIDDPLSQPTRARIFRVMGELAGPVGTEDLAARLALHPNGVRLHLDKLLAAGLVVRERVRQPRGRPRDVWAIASGAQPGGAPPTAYADLGRWLARAVRGGRGALRPVEATGRDVGRDLAPVSAAGAPEAKMFATLSALGFAPRRDLDREGELTYELGNCPYRDAVLENRDAVCTLHRGLTQGLIDRLSPASRLAAFVPKDPMTAGCLITLRGPLATDATPPAGDESAGGGGS